MIFKPLRMDETGYSTPPKGERASIFKRSPSVKLLQSPSGNFTVWEQDDYSDSRFFDPSSHIWTSAHDLKLLFQHIKEDLSFIDDYKELMKDDHGLDYHAFAITKRGGGVFSFGHNGGRDDCGSAAYIDSQGHIMIWLENAKVAKVAEVDRSSQLASWLET